MDFFVSYFDTSAREEWVVIAYSNDGGIEQAYTSIDLGLTWVEFEDECAGPKNKHTQGFYCSNTSGTLSWFDHDTMIWST